MSTINEQENPIVTSGYANTMTEQQMAQAQNTTVTTTGSTSTFSIGTLGQTLVGDSNLTWTYDGTTTQPDPGTFLSGSGGWTTGTTTWPVVLPEATKEELQKIIKNKEVQIEINGEMKTCKLADLLETGYLTLKSI